MVVTKEILDELMKEYKGPHCLIINLAEKGGVPQN